MADKLSGFSGTSMVIGGVVVATGLTVLKDLLEGNINMKPIIGGFVVGTALLITAFFSTPIAAALALLLLVSSILINAEPVLVKVMFG